RQGRGDRGNAQAADRRLERGDSSQTLRADPAGTKGSESCLTDSTLSSAANATTDGHRSGDRGGWGGVVRSGETAGGTISARSVAESSPWRRQLIRRSW